MTRSKRDWTDEQEAELKLARLVYALDEGASELEDLTEKEIRSRFADPDSAERLEARIKLALRNAKVEEYLKALLEKREGVAALIEKLLPRLDPKRIDEIATGLRGGTLQKQVAFRDLKSELTENDIAILAENLALLESLEDE